MIPALGLTWAGKRFPFLIFWEGTTAWITRKFFAGMGLRFIASASPREAREAREAKAAKVKGPESTRGRKSKADVVVGTLVGGASIF